MTGKRGTLAFAALLAAALGAQAQDVEVWRYEGEGGPGLVRISGAAGERSLEWSPEQGDSRTGRENKENVFLFPSSPGAAGVLENLTGRRDGVMIRARGKGYQVAFFTGREITARGTLTRQAKVRAALLAPAMPWNEPEGRAFTNYAREMASYYKQRDFGRTDVAPIASVEVLIATLNQAGAEGRPYERVVLIGHGGWDGPMFHGQQASATSNPELWEQLIAAIQRGTTADARIFSSSCHAGGSNKYETTGRAYRWTDDLARRTGRVVSGPMGKTSTEYTYQNTLAALEGVGGTRQEVRWASAEGVRTIGVGGNYKSAKLLPMPEPVEEDGGGIRPTSVRASIGRTIDLPLGEPAGQGGQTGDVSGVPAPLPPTRPRDGQ